MTIEQSSSLAKTLRFSLAAVLALVALILPSASSAKVKILKSEKYDISTYKTYHWVPPRLMSRQGELEEDNEWARLIMQLVNAELASKGYVQVPADGDFQINSGAFSVSSSQLEGFLIQWGFDYSWGWGGWFGPTAMAPVTRENREGILVIMFVDPDSQQGAWGGVEKTLIGKPKTISKTIKKAVKNILKKMPEHKD